MVVTSYHTPSEGAADRPAQTERSTLVDDDFECAAEFIDGVWTYCCCPDCQDREYADTQEG